MSSKTKVEQWQEFYLLLWKLQESGSLAPVVWPSVFWPQQKKKQVEERRERTPRYKWVDVGADRFIFTWLNYYGEPGLPLPPSPDGGNQADLERAIKKLFAGKTFEILDDGKPVIVDVNVRDAEPCPKHTAILDHIKKCIKAEQKAG